jgi:hypothetical protein
MSVFLALFTTKSIGHDGLHQTSAEVRSLREATNRTALGFAFGNCVFALSMCIVRGFHER